jgi:hypothetical protein
MSGEGFDRRSEQPVEKLTANKSNEESASHIVRRVAD